MTNATAVSAEVLSERLFTAVTDALELYHVYLGDRLGLYRALADRGPSTAGELAVATRLAPRYVREWLEQQAVAGVLAVAEEHDDGERRRFALPDGAAAVLLDPESPFHIVALAAGAVACAHALPELIDVFASGEGIPYARYGDDVRGCIARVNRPMFATQLATEWFPAVPELHARLSGGTASRVADVGCGSGWSSISIARAYPHALVEGFDLDDASIAAAAENADSAGVADRVTFTAADARSLDAAQPYDLVCAFETVHDMADPVGALRAMRRLAGDSGVVLVADEKVAETFTAPGDALERFNYGWSLLHCLPVGLTQPGSPGTGTIMRTSVFRGYARAAGFSRVEVLPIEHDFWRFYRLHR